MSISPRGRALLWLALILIVLASLALVLTPVWLIQPFKPQTNRGVAVSFVMRSWSPLVTVIAFVLAATIVLYLWRGARRWWRKVALVVIILPLLPVTWLARQNHFEWMFNPMPNAAYSKANAANHVGDSDMVLAVENNGEAVAYPIRLMAYHHVVQDVVGGTPIVATY
jgi:MFS family permease